MEMLESLIQNCSAQVHLSLVQADLILTSLPLSVLSLFGSQNSRYPHNLMEILQNSLWLATRVHKQISKLVTMHNKLLQDGIEAEFSCLWRVYFAFVREPFFDQRWRPILFSVLLANLLEYLLFSTDNGFRPEYARLPKLETGNKGAIRQKNSLQMLRMEGIEDVMEEKLQ
ncbi:hypothetical protein BLNAU_24440 [Blattamonas nauphoetae]|uniref:Uncharacterized protein n=1 Tax=Blattamonas nauphoetae TaxID=2049346 RepID=A0ABQ9WME8_9EUKA|nr:hypothetical protein BLNAU_24440 [Blattamonas nauphoetae]